MTDKYPHKITVYISDVYHKEKTVTDTKQVADIIRRTISHLGKTSIYYEKRPKTLWQKLIASMAGKGYI